MRHRKHTFKIGPGVSYRKAMLMNLVNGLFTHERIKTTLPKAREARRLAEKMITLAKKNTLHTRRLALKKLRNKNTVGRLFSTYGQRYAGRNGGYTRIIKLGRRPSDDAPLVYLELVDRLGVETEPKKTKEKKAPAPKPAKAPSAKAEQKKPETAPVEETPQQQTQAEPEPTVHETPEKTAPDEQPPAQEQPPEQSPQKDIKES